MAVYPGAVNMLIPRGTIGGAGQQPRIKPTIIILHTNAGNVTLAGAARLMATTTSGQEYHFQQETGSGRLGQYVDTTIRADNNYKANSFTVGGVLCGAISVETADLGAPYDKSWTDLGQRKNLEDLVVWLCQTHNIPARQCPDPFAPGIGYHSLWGLNTTSNPNVNPWTNTLGKICPGPGKIREFPDLLAAVARRIQGKAEDMPLTDDDVRRIWSYGLPTRFGVPGAPAEVVVADTRIVAGQASNQTDTVEGSLGTLTTYVTELADAVAKLTEKVDNITTGGVDVAAIAKAVNDDAAARLAE